MNDIETFTEVYERYASMIVKSVVAQTNDVELANEICQNVFLAYYNNMYKVEKEFVKAWLLHAAKNQLIDHWRKTGARKKVMQEIGIEDLNRVEDKRNLEKRCDDRQFICEILDHLKEVNILWYEVIDCICIRQMTPEEACSYLEISPGALRSRLNRARSYLREMYDDQM